MEQTRLHCKSPVPDPVESDTQMPSRCGVVIVGAGIAGASTALALAGAGVRTVLCEKGIVAGEQSSRNWGWVRKMNRDPRELPLMLESLRIWERFNQSLDVDTGFRRSGIAYLCKTASDVEKYENWLDQVQGCQVDSRLISRAEIDDVLPGCRGDWQAAFYNPTDARAEPQKVTPAIARAAQRHGATVVTNCAVRGIETTAGRVSGVVTENGPIDCDSVVIAAGAWSRLFCRSVGVRFPQLLVVSSVMRTEAIEDGPEIATWGQGFAFRKRLDGGYSVANGGWNDVDLVPDSFRFAREFLPALQNDWNSLRFRIGRKFLEAARQPSKWSMDDVSPFERIRILNPVPSQKALKVALRSAAQIFPAFENLKVEQGWAGAIDATPDALPVISEVTTQRGLFLISGFSGHGFGIGPGAGYLMSDLVRGISPRVDPEPFRFSRFSDGSQLMPMPRSV
jgi:glycine/D-amino acid oxidase-like deaminating enzyme